MISFNVYQRMIVAPNSSAQADSLQRYALPAAAGRERYAAGQSGLDIPYMV